MKRKLLIILTALCLCGCGNTEVDSSEMDSENTTESESNIDSESTSELTSETENATETESSSEQEGDNNSEIQSDSEEDFFTEDRTSWEKFTLSTDDDVEVVYDGDTELSLKIERMYFPMPAAHGVDFCYGLTIDKSTDKIRYIQEYIPRMDDLIEQIEAGNYGITYGVYHDWTKEQIIESIEEEFDWKKWDTYFSNFYIDDTHIYIIVPTAFSDYSILHLEKDILSGSAAIETEVPDEELTLMQKVLLNKAEFYGTVDPYEKEYGWHKVEEIYGYGWYSAQFGIVDFDHDGEDEVYVYYGDALILHEEDGVIYGYCEPYRGLLRVCTNGTFWGSSGAADNDWCANVSFDKSEFRYDFVNIVGDYNTQTGTYTKGTSVTNETGWYVENKAEITEEEYDKLESQYPRGEDVEEYICNVDNILKYVK